MASLKVNKEAQLELSVDIPETDEFENVLYGGCYDSDLDVDAILEEMEIEIPEVHLVKWRKD